MNAPILAGQVGGENRPGVRSHFGQSGSGKTFAMHDGRDRLMKAAPESKCLELDIGHDVDTVPTFLQGKFSTHSNVNEAIGSLERGARLAAVRLPDGSLEAHWTKAADIAAAWALKGRRLSPNVERIVVISEAHFAIPNKPLSGNMLTLITAWRKRSAALLYDSQRPTLVSKTLRAQTAEHNFFVLTEKDDKEYAMSFGGVHNRDAHERNELGRCPQCAMARSLQEIEDRFARGEPGCHVRLGLVRSPPFPVIKV